MTMSSDPTITPAEEADLSQTGKTGRGRSAASAASGALKEARTFLDKDKAKRMAGKARDTAAETMSTLTDRVNAARDQVQHSAEAARDWAKQQADHAAEAAKQLHAERPVLVISVSAGAALAVGLLAGFVIGRATADDY
jgi:ElaB/YqjD/DUF883 family membrane-anchored ribosome-binding protein